jgi:hypothetical protein
VTVRMALVVQRESAASTARRSLVRNQPGARCARSAMGYALGFSPPENGFESAYARPSGCRPTGWARAVTRGIVVAEVWRRLQVPPGPSSLLSVMESSPHPAFAPRSIDLGHLRPQATDRGRHRADQGGRHRTDQDCRTKWCADGVVRHGAGRWSGRRGSSATATVIATPVNLVPAEAETQRLHGTCADHEVVNDLPPPCHRPALAV